MKTAGLILAAGKSTRFKGSTPKFLHLLLGKRIIDYVTDTIHPFVDDLLYVSSTDHLVHPKAIIQENPRGTGDTGSVLPRTVAGIESRHRGAAPGRE